LGALQEGERDLWAQVCVRFKVSIPPSDDPEGPLLIGYYRNIGFRSRIADPQLLIEKIFPEGTINWADTEYYEIDVTKLDRDIRKRVTEPDESGVWYRSGRILFPADDVEAAKN